MAGVLPDFILSVPAEIQTALDGILTDVYSLKVRQDIVDSLTWGIQQTFPVAAFLNSLGLKVQDHLLCYTNTDPLVAYDAIPADVQSRLDRILTDVSGLELRADITYVLRWGSDYTSTLAGFIEDLGLTVVDGKLCAMYHPLPFEENKGRRI